MKLRTQFLLLIAGIIVIPLIVAVTTALVQLSLDRQREPYPNYFEYSRWLRTTIPDAVENGSFAEIVRHRPPGLDFVIFDRDRTVIASTVPAFPSGETVPAEAILDYVKQNSRYANFQYETSEFEDGIGNLILIKTPRPHGRPDFRARFFSLGVAAAAALLLFSSIMSFLILRSITRSVLRLEHATRRIAEGDLDFALSVRGNDEVASLTRSFDRMRRSLKEEYARRARFIMGVSHDLKTPLALIQGYAEAIDDGMAGDPAALEKYVSIISEKSRYLESLIETLIDFMKLETGEWKRTHTAVRLKEFFEELGARYAEDAVILGRKFEYRVEDLPREAAVQMDRGLVNRAFENILGNAIRYTPPGGTIGLTVGATGGNGLLDMAVVEIRDSGIGIPEGDLENIFDPFHRGSNSRREEGTGLGLAIVKSVFDSHGFRMTVASRPGEGTVFTVRIPLVEARHDLEQ